MNYAVEMLGISKAFGSVQALDSVDLRVAAGTIHAVVGENGAGKTTLMRILYGSLSPSPKGGGPMSGANRGEGAPGGQEKEPLIRIQAYGREEAPSQFGALKGGRSRSRLEALRAESPPPAGYLAPPTNGPPPAGEGVGMVSQHYAILPELDCLQNLILGAEGGAWIDVAAARKRADELAAKMGFEFDWSQDAATLSPAAAQKLEILKLLWRNARIMILDEPTAMLSPADGEALFSSLSKLTAEGATVILVTHRLPEVFEHCSHVTVLRGGKVVGDMEVSQTDEAALAHLIVGDASPLAQMPVAEELQVREPLSRQMGEGVGGEGPDGDEVDASPLAQMPVAEELQAREPLSRQVGEGVGGEGPDGDEVDAVPALVIHGLRARGARGNEALKGIDLEVRKGELLGIAGVDGSGQRELLQALLGVLKPIGGTIEWEGRPLPLCSASQRIAMGIRLIAEDRQSEGMIGAWSLEENAALGLQRLRGLRRGALIDAPGRRAAAAEIAARFDTKHAGLGMPMISLSGGNQQRFVAGRALQADPRLILAFQPARGLDIRGARQVYEGLRAACDAGAIALVVSFDLDELLQHCDRVAVMNRGELFEPDRLDREAIGRLMVSAS